MNLDIAGNVAQPRYARSRVITASEITVDLNARPLETAIRRPSAVMNAQIPTHGNIAFEQCRFTVIGFDIAADRRGLGIGLNYQGCALRDVYVSGDGGQLDSAGGTLEHGNITIDHPG